MNTESCHCGLLSCKEVNTRDKDNKFTLQPLPYAENSLEPYISEKTVKFHYGKHLAAYIDNTNKLKAGTQFDDQPIHEIIKKVIPILKVSHAHFIARQTSETNHKTHKS